MAKDSKQLAVGMQLIIINGQEANKQLAKADNKKEPATRNKEQVTATRRVGKFKRHIIPSFI